MPTRSGVPPLLSCRALVVWGLATAATACAASSSTSPTSTGGGATTGDGGAGSSGAGSSGATGGTSGSSSSGSSSGSTSSGGESDGAAGETEGGSGAHEAGGPDAAGSSSGASTTDSGSAGPFPFKPAYILGADISWETQHEAEGYTYSDGTTTKTMTAIMAENGFNFIRLRTFVDPGASDGYSPGQDWCGQADTVTMAKRAKNCGLGVFIDFHMSDSWESLGTNGDPSTMALAWRSLSQEVPNPPASASTHYTNNLYQAAHDYVAGVMQALVAAGAKPDMVQIGNETNSGMGGVPMSNWAAFSAFVNAGITAVRETDPRIIVWAQNGRPRPNSAGGDNFDGWVDEYLSDKAPYIPTIDEDGICGSTYGTTDNGADWTTSFDYVINTYNKPVMSCEYDDASPNSPAGAVINRVMRAFPNGMGRGSFIWEPADYPAVNSNTLFTLTGKVYTTNAAMTAYPTLAKSYGLPVPSGTCE